MRVARITVEILKPIPLAAFTARTQTIRDGRSVQVVAGSLSVDGSEILRAQAVKIRAAAGAPETPRAPLPGPEHGHAPEFFPTGVSVGYHTGMEATFLRGNFMDLGPATAWMRMRHPLIAGEPTLPLARVLIAADSGNGISSSLDYRNWIFINPDLTVYLHRQPVGEWIALDAVTTVGERGIGLAESTIHDAQGPVGRGLQSLFITERRSSR